MFEIGTFVLFFVLQNESNNKKQEDKHNGKFVI